MNKSDKLVLAHLTEHIPLELREEMKAASDWQIKALLLKLTPEEARKILVGPNGAKFTENANAALQRLAAAQTEK